MSFFNVTLKCFTPNKGKCLQTAPFTPRQYVIPRRVVLRVLGAKDEGPKIGRGAQVWPFLGDLARTRQRRPGTAKHAVVAWHQRILAATPSPATHTTFSFLFYFVLFETRLLLGSPG